MQIGVCGNMEKARVAAEVGYDYAEFNLSKLALMTDEEFDALLCEKNALGLPVPTFNGAFPSDVKLTVDVDTHAVAAYAETAFSRAQRIGGEIVVVGSGRSRAVPENYDLSAAKDGFVRTLGLIDSHARRYGIKLAIEPLRVKETNFINTLAEGAEICSLLGSDNVGCTLDLFHFDQNGEPMSDIRKYSEFIFHTHLARRNADRRIPTLDDRAEVEEFVGALNAIGYTGKMSLEGIFYPDFESGLNAAMQLFRAIGIK